MSKIKKILMTIFTMLLLILGINTVSQSYSVGQYINISYWDYIGSKRILCMEHGQRLRDTVTYKIISNVKIEGNKSTDHEGKTIESWDNAKMVAILTSDKSVWQVKNAVWNFGYTWIKNVAVNHAGVYSSFATPTRGFSTSLDQEATDYANSLQNTASEITDLTNKENLKADSVKVGENSYTRAGKFTWKFSEELETIKAYDQNGKEITDLKFASYEGDKLLAGGLERVKSETGFYILIPNNNEITKISKVLATQKTSTKAVNIWFLQAVNYYNQNLILTQPNTGSNDVELEKDYNISTQGNLKIIKVDQNNEEVKLKDVGFYVQNKNTGKYVKQNSNKQITYVDKKEDATEFITDKNGEISIENLIVGTYVAYETKNPNYGYEIITEGKEKQVKIDKTAELKIPNKKIVGNLKIIKVKKDDEIVKLQGVGFYIQNKETGKYVKQGGNNEITYVDKKADATEFITDQNGKILVNNLITGTYVAYETKNPNYGYILNQEGQEANVPIDKTAELKIYNESKFIKVSGYVWQDKIDGKQSVRNNLYNDGEQDTQDIKVEGITVRLKNKSGNTIKTTKTDKEGAYLFEEVDVSSLADYYIEFEYDGLTYEPVTTQLDKENGSKATENAQTRTGFNNNFASVQGSGEATGFTTNTSGNKAYDLTYNKNKAEYTSTLVKDTEKFKMVATTNSVGYSLKDAYTGKDEEIKNINLGIYEREQPDLAIIKDVQNAKVTVNGYEHTYQYAQRFINQGEYGDGFNVGVKFGSKYGSMSYTRAIYKSDVEYQPEDASKEIKVYITYKIQVLNQSTNIVGQVNSFVDYYDARYIIKKIGTAIDENGNITGEVQSTEPTKYNDKYNKVEINGNLKIDAQKTQDIYVQFELNRQAVLDIMNDKATLNNVVEIASYTSFSKDGKIYAGIDVDSNPGNANPEDKTTFEDDTDSAPSLKLELTNAREITGKVFLDETNPDLMTGQIREGDGEYKDGEKGIKDVEVSLIDENGNVVSIYDETSKSWKQATGIKTDENGDFKISGFIPGKYKVTYTWGDETYTVQNYKGTIYQEKDRANHLDWYKTENPRYSDAMDDWNVRKIIDKQIANGVAQGEEKITKMKSTTPTMEFGVEYETTITDGTADRVVFTTQNVDFGIVERARQRVTLDKHVKSFKITLANGTVIVDAVINEEGKLEGQIQGVSGSASLDYIKAELDNEILQNANIEIGYEIIATNISENDYVSENGDYYFYGEKQAGNNKGELVKLQITEARDYLESTLNLKEGQENIWKIDDEDTSVEGRKVFTTSLKAIAPTEQTKVEMLVSKDLANEEDIRFENLVVASKIRTTPGITTENPYGPEVSPAEDEAEPVIVINPQGANLNYVVPITLGLSTLAILGVGIWFIKKKVLDR